MLRGLAVASAVALAGLFVGVALLRMTYPFELEWVEGAILDHVRVALTGRPIYGEPTVEFIPLHYPPLYYYVSAIPAALLGIGFAPLRLVSLLSSVGCAALIFALVKRETGHRLAAVVAGSLYLASFERSGGWLDLARVDAFLMLLLAASVHAIRFAERRPALILAGALLAAATLAKQTAVVVALPLGACALLLDARRGAWWIGSAAGFWLLALGLLGATSDGYFFYYSFGIPRNHPIVWEQVRGFWTEDLVPMAVAILASAAWLLTPDPGHGARRRLFYLALAVGTLGAAWSIRSLEGAYLNDVVPAYFGIAVLSGLGLARALDWAAAPPDSAAGASWRPALAGACWGLVLLQFGALAWDPRDHLPTAGQRAGGEALVAQLRAIDGEVFIPYHSPLAQMAGKRGSAHASAIQDILFDGSHEVAHMFRRRLGRALANQRFAAVIAPAAMGFGPALHRFYPRVEPLRIGPAALEAVESGALPPEVIYWRGDSSMSR